MFLFMLLCRSVLELEQAPEEDECTQNLMNFYSGLLKVGRTEGFVLDNNIFLAKTIIEL